MKQIITLEKEIAFKTMVGEITSISLEPDLSFINDSEIEGNLIISGSYKMTEASTLEENFNYKIPVEIMLTTKLFEDKRKVDINNFTYNIINEDALGIKVELIIEGLEKIEIEEVIDSKEDNKEIEEVIDSREGNKEIEILTTEEDITSLEKELLSVEEVTSSKEEQQESNQVMDSIFSVFSNTPETYSTYSVYILREEDNLEEIIAKYKTNREILAEYNNLDDLKVGTKLIIPNAINNDQ